MYGRMEIEVHFLFNSTMHKISQYKFIPIRWTEVNTCCPPCCGFNFCYLTRIANKKFFYLNKNNNYKRSQIVYNREYCSYGFYIIKCGVGLPNS